MITSLNFLRTIAFTASLPLMALFLPGCPATTDTKDQADYDKGFNVGFLVDEEYWTGFDDSWDTRDGGDIYYTGDEIPKVEDPPYDAGYWDGRWYAYNDGYFVSYDYAFTIGFSEGYDVGYQPGWKAFLLADKHVEWLDGGFSDGYNDGFSEGRILGAVDYDLELPFDWLDAMEYYRQGKDVYIDEIDLGTGEYGPVTLYTYGVDPKTLVKSASIRDKAHRAPLSIRKSTGTKALEPSEEPTLSYRDLSDTVKGYYNTAPETSPRAATVALRVKDTTWLQRVEAYRSAGSSTTKSDRQARSAR